MIEKDRLKKIRGSGIAQQLQVAWLVIFFFIIVIRAPLQFGVMLVEIHHPKTKCQPLYSVFQSTNPMNLRLFNRNVSKGLCATPKTIAMFITIKLNGTDAFDVKPLEI